MFGILFVGGASTFPQIYYIHELTVQLKNLIKIKDSWRHMFYYYLITFDLVDISYTVHNCPNTEIIGSIKLMS